MMGAERQGLVKPTAQAAKVAPAGMQQRWVGWGRSADTSSEAIVKPPKPQFRGVSQELGAARSDVVIMPKLMIGAPGDRYEQEADRVAQQVVQRLNTPNVGRSPSDQTLQRAAVSDEVGDLQRLPMGRSGEKIGGGEASPDLAAAITSARGSGRPLVTGLQQAMGQAMGADFSGVRVHTDAQADQLNRSIQAKAFTTGQDVFFRQGAYEPGSRGGQELIAHELAHVVQQDTGMPIRRNLNAAQVITDAQEVNPTFNRFKTSSLMPTINAVRHYNLVRTQQALDNIRTAMAAISTIKRAKYQIALTNLSQAVDIEEKRLRALRATGARQKDPEGQTERVVALRNWIEKVANHIRGEEFQAAFAKLSNYDKLAAPTAIDNIQVKQVRATEAATPDIAVEIAKDNMAFAEEDRIRLCFPTDWKWINSEDTKTVKAALLMHLEEYMHIYQARSGEYLSSSTGLFKESDVAPPDMAEDGILREQDYDYDETDVMAQMIDWGFDPEDIDYVDRYDGRKEYWKWRKG
jgi:hypothetical protein